MHICIRSRSPIQTGAPYKYSHTADIDNCNSARAPEQGISLQQQLKATRQTKP